MGEVPDGRGHRGACTLAGVDGHPGGRLPARSHVEDLASAPTAVEGRPYRVDEALDPAGAVADLAGTRQIALLEPGDPDRIGPYDLLCRLPRGGQGADVFVGSAGSDAALVVIKQLPAAAPELARKRLARDV